MRKLVFILIAFIAVATFIRAFDNSAGINAEGMRPDRINSENFHAAKALADPVSGK